MTSPRFQPDKTTNRDVRSPYGEPQLRALMEAAVDGIISIDEMGTIQTTNPATETLFGYSADEMIGKNVKLLMPEPYREEHDEYIRHYLSTGVKRIIGIGREVFGRRKDGSVFPMELSVAEAKVDGERIFMGIVRNIEERQNAAEYFRLVVESVPNAIVIVNAEGIITFVNSQAERYFGYDRTEIIGHTVELLVPERFRPAHPKYRANYFLNPETRPMGAGRDLFGRRKDGTEFPIEIGLNPVQTGEGAFVLATLVDITERKRVEEALCASNERLQLAVEDLQAKNEEVRTMTQQLWQSAKLASVGELAASIAHELNNPLATICLRVESILKNTMDDDPRRRPLEIVDQEARRMGDLVANLLQFSRRNEEKTSTVDLRQELSRSVELVRHHLRKQEVTIVLELAPTTPSIFADRQKLRQVFLNLLTNAGDSMPRGGTLTIRSESDVISPNRPAVRIEIVDTGVGIPSENLEKIMDPFFTTKEEGKGTGLGLAICRRVVEDHGGSIEILSQVEKGTTVRIRLPVQTDANVLSLQKPQ